MKIDTLKNSNNQWEFISNNIDEKSNTSIVFLFGDSDHLKHEQSFNSIKEKYPSAIVVGASTSGNILGAEIVDNPIVATAVEFEKGSVALSKVNFTDNDKIEDLSFKLISQLPHKNLKHIFVMSDGLNINGSELVRGINNIGRGVPVTGGMAGDGDRFQETWTIADAPAKQNQIIAIGFYGENFTITTGCNAGWSSFGADRIVTKSTGNVLYELDNQPALDLYKEYLGEFAKDLPNSGMRFPLNIKESDESVEVIRTLLAIDEDAKSITFAGDIPEGYTARLMKPDIQILIDGAESSAKDIDTVNSDTALGLVVSCVGRRVVLKQAVEEELEVIEEVLNENVQLTGFYSYGEIAPFRDDLMICQLHNQTMTLTAIYEK
jgi:hypothetical protein